MYIYMYKIYILGSLGSRSTVFLCTNRGKCKAASTLNNAQHLRVLGYGPFGGCWVYNWSVLLLLLLLITITITITIIMILIFLVCIRITIVTILSTTTIADWRWNSLAPTSLQHFCLVTIVGSENEAQCFCKRCAFPNLYLWYLVSGILPSCHQQDLSAS